MYQFLEKETLEALKPDLVSSWTLVGAFSVLVFNFVLLETLATSLTIDQFAWNKRRALEYMGALMSVGAVIACVTFALIGPLTKLFEERSVLLQHYCPFYLNNCTLSYIQLIIDLYFVK